MSIIRHLAVALLMAASIAGCLYDEEMELEEEESIGSVEAEIESAPVCQTETEAQSEWRRCGIKPNGNPAHMLCTRTCTTHKEMHWNTIPPYCEVGPTICSQWVCGPCND